MLKNLFVILLASFAEADEKYVNFSGSMLPAIEIKQRLEIKTAEPSTAVRGELWAYANPEKPEETFVKRVVGLAGDKIKVTDGMLTLNGKVVSKKLPQNRDQINKISEEHLPQGKAGCDIHREIIEPIIYKVILCHKKEKTDYEGTVPADTLFFLGDNRDNSFDSRIIGAIPFAKIKGKVVSNK